jgi:coproporphyrinogen III oxidase-like Fe-S oxidoreductase
VADWKEYIRRTDAGESPIGEKEDLTPDQRRIEVIFTSLRTSEGLELGALGAQKASLLERWRKEGLGEVTNGRFVLTFAGRMLADEIAKALL